MKICIVTVYNSINSGSYWQARTLQKVLEDKGCQVFFYKRKNTFDSSSSRLRQCMIIVKSILNNKLERAIRLKKQYIEFKKAQRVFKVVKHSYLMNNEVVCILGSDTIWNLEDKYFENNRNIYFGGIFKGKKVVSYAASVGNTSLNKLESFDDIKSMLCKLLSISVRDNYSKMTIEKCIGKSVNLVCDPTLLLRKEEYLEILGKDRLIKEKYIYIYAFEDLDITMKNVIVKYAKYNKLSIIGGMDNVTCSDYNIINSPMNFLNAFMYATFIITDTFHGTLFSINLEKEFVVINRNKQKVNDLIKAAGIKEVLLNNSDELSTRLYSVIDYEKVSKLIEKYRQDSMFYIDNEIIKNN